MTRKNVLKFGVGLAGEGDIGAALRGIGDKAEAAFNDIKKAAEGAGAAGRDIGKSLGEVQRAFDEVRQNARKAKAEIDRVASAESGIRTLGATISRVAGLFAGIFAVRSLVSAADTVTDLTDRLKLAVDATTSVDDAWKQLLRTANNSEQDVGAVTEAFLQQSAALTALGYTTQQQLDFTEALTNAFAISGAKGQQMESVTNALTKAMATGTLRGQDFNTVLAAGGPLVQLLADYFRVNVNELRNLAAQGKITGGVLGEVLLGNAAALREEVEGMNFTIRGAVMQMSNNFKDFVKSMDSATGASGLVAGAIRLIARNLDIVIPAIAVFMALWAAKQFVDSLSIIKDMARGLLQMALAINLANLPMILFLASIVAVAGGVAHLTGVLDPLYERLGLIDASAKAAAEGAEDLGAAAANAGAGARELGAQAGQAGAETGAAMEDAAERTEGAFGEAFGAVGGLVKTFAQTAKPDLAGIIAQLKEIIALAQKAAQAIKSSSGRAQGGLIGFAGGGAVHGPGTSTSDSIPARLSAGEFVMQARAVRRNGLRFMAMINSGALSVRDLAAALPGFAAGGMVPGLAPALAGGRGLAGTGGGRGALRPLHVHIAGQEFPVLAEDDVAEAMVRVASRSAARKAGSAPSWSRG